MKKVAIRVKSYTGNVNIVNNNNLSVKLFRVALFSICALALCYTLLLGSMVFNIVDRQSLSVESKSLSNEVGDLELRYLSLSSKIDKALSTQMGFKEAKAEYASRRSFTALSIASNEL